MKQCEEQALKLASHERALLAERLIESLDELDAVENERIWIEEAERRYSEYKSGKVTARSAAEVMRDARSAIQ
ncbi:MAG: addiction module protein [Chitinivibrionales bacterium]|nr:addiction module protein [Chitinivibrionales bacterium]